MDFLNKMDDDIILNRCDVFDRPTFGTVVKISEIILSLRMKQGGSGQEKRLRDHSDDLAVEAAEMSI